ncbi:ribonuclease H-like domain-containing protein, partial [Tanacetum coccineum]
MTCRGTFFNGNAWFNINFSRYYYANTSLVVKTITLGWIIDYGANQHLSVSTVGMYNVVDVTSLKIIVGHSNGTLATISHIGNLKLSKNVVLYDVLVVPRYCVSLLFVNKLIKDSKVFVGFNEDKCYIQDLKKEITLGTSSKFGGLYLFDMDNNKSIGNINMVMSFNVSKDLWHSRLGHPADQVLNVLKSDLNLSKNTKFDVKIKTARSDNGTEFVNKKMYELFSDLGIIQQTSCTHTPQQNGIPKRKHRYMLNAAMSLILKCDKLTSKSKKCVLIGYSSVKKAYKLFSLDNRNALFSRDVRFYETVFPFKIRNKNVNDGADVSVTNEADHLTFFDNQMSSSPNDKGRAVFVVEGKVPSGTYTAQMQTSKVDSATQLDDNNQSKGNVSYSNISSESNAPVSRSNLNTEEGESSVRRSSRSGKMPVKFNDYVVESNVKYGLEKHELEKALNIHEEWECEQKLPEDYERIMKMIENPESQIITKKDLYSLLSSGTLLNNRKMWLSLSRDGKVNEMISATTFSYENLMSSELKILENS